jgi:hypothetical protein
VRAVQLVYFWRFWFSLLYGNVFNDHGETRMLWDEALDLWLSDHTKSIQIIFNVFLGGVFYSEKYVFLEFKIKLLQLNF